MIRSLIFRQDMFAQYMDAFNHYAVQILYGGNILIGADIEDDYKDIPVD